MSGGAVRTVPTWRVLAAFVRRDLLIQTSYRSLLLLQLFYAFTLLLSTWFLGVTVGAVPLIEGYGGDYFAFAVLGLATIAPMNAALETMAGKIREAQIEGTLEAILVTPVGARRAVVLSSVFDLAWSLVRMGLFVGAAALLFDVPLIPAQLPLAMLILALGVLAHLALGLLSASFTLVLKRGDPVTHVIQHVSALLGGVLFPPEVLPAWLQALSQLLPLTHALQALRLVLLVGASPAEVARPIAALAVFVAVAVPVSVIVFERALSRAKDEGSLTHY